MAVEQVARWPWNAWPDESGLGGRMAWNPQAEESRSLRIAHSADVLCSFIRLAEMVVESVFSNHEQTHILTQLRDTLLPCLISG